MDDTDTEILNELMDEMLEAYFLYGGCSPQLKEKWKAHYQETRGALMDYIEALIQEQMSAQADKSGQ